MPKRSRLPVAPTRSRDREATTRALVDAAKGVLADAGFHSFGVNEISRRAGCDKQLIYRYFGGLEGVADAVGADLAEDLSRELTPLTLPEPPTTYAQLMEQLAFGLLELLLRNRVVQQITTWETAMPSPLVRRMVEARSQKLARWMHEMRGDLAPPPGVDAPAINAILIAGIQQLVLSSVANGEFAGLRLESSHDWKRLKAALTVVIAAIYGRSAGDDRQDG
jgi:AcrR family transcriptional regulator